MREILFSGKIKESKSKHEELNWAFGNFIRELETGKCFISDLSHFERDTKLSDVILEVDPGTVCQYTGLTDKNGRKIFEGDIITYQHDNDDCPFPNKDTKRRVGRVYFQEFRSCFAVAEGRNGSDMINQDLFKYVQNGNRVQVIGNIFDNPELVKEVAE